VAAARRSETKLGWTPSQVELWRTLILNSAGRLFMVAPVGRNNNDDFRPIGANLGIGNTNVNNTNVNSTNVARMNGAGKFSEGGIQWGASIALAGN
jgi:hypothetical protein